MKLATLQAGQFVETGGYYVKGDAGQAKYLIVAAQAADGYGDHTLANGTIAVLQVGSVIELASFGVISNNAASSSSNTLALIAVVDYLRGAADHLIINCRGNIYAEYLNLSTLTANALRNIVFRGAGGILGAPDDVGAAFVFTGTTSLPEYKAGAQTQLLISSVYNLEFDGVGINSTAAPAGAEDRQVAICAGVSPAFSSHLVRFKNLELTASAGVTFQTPPVLVFATKFFKTDNVLMGYPENDVGIQYGLDDGDVPSLLMKGAVENCSATSTFYTADIVLQNVRGLTIDASCQFDLLKSGNGGSRIISGGDEKASNVDISASFIHVDNRGPAIVQASRDNSAQLLGSKGWRVKSIFRDRIIGVQVTTGNINLDGCEFQSRTNNTGTVKGVVIDNGAEQVVIGDTTDFGVLQENNHVAVEDNRTNPIAGMVVDIAVASDTTLGASGSNQTILTSNSSRKLRGGSYRVSYSISVRSNATSRYKAQLSVNGVAVDVAKSFSSQSGIDFTFDVSRLIKLTSDTTSPSTFTLQVNQESAGTLAVIRGGTSLGDTWLQVEEVG